MVVRQDWRLISDVGSRFLNVSRKTAAVPPPPPPPTSPLVTCASHNYYMSSSTFHHYYHHHHCGQDIISMSTGFKAQIHKGKKDNKSPKEKRFPLLGTKKSCLTIWPTGIYLKGRNYHHHHHQHGRTRGAPRGPTERRPRKIGKTIVE